MKLADMAHYPAIDLNGSISRLAQNLLKPDDFRLANQVRRLWSTYQQNADLIQVGAYESGTNPELDMAMRLMPGILHFLRQDMNTPHDLDATWDQLRQLLGGS